nr:hypothetical protein [Aquicoccus sp. G2-2]MEA1115000.1 hypothetical protein [Aquicoccus sp. G2-2]
MHLDFDMALVVGIIVGIFAIPSVVSSLSDKHTPRVAAIALIVGGGLVAWAVTQKPGGYQIDEIPSVVVQVIGRFVN